MPNKDSQGIDGKVQGFICGQGFFPAPMIVIYSKEGEHFARYSNYKSIEISEEVFQESLKHQHFYTVEGNLKIQENEYAFAISPEKVLMGSHEEIVNQLEKELEERTLDKRERAIIEDYLLINE